MSQILFDTVWTIVSLVFFLGISSGIVYLIYKLCRFFGTNTRKNIFNKTA